MRLALRAAVVATFLACVALVLSSGRFEWMPSGVECLATLVLFVVAVVLMIAFVQGLARQRHEPDGRHLPWGAAAWAGGYVLVAATCIVLRIPVRITFAACHDELERVAREHREDPDTIVFRIGPHRVLGVADDPRGGTYVRVSIEPAILESWHYGFAKDANEEGTPWANAGYSRTALGDGWSWFAANDDW